MPGLRALLILTVLASAGDFAAAQISPGPLSKAHQSLEGGTQCTRCHVAGVRRSEFLCVACHTEIAQRMQAQRGYHARAASPERKGADCAECHSEHNGVEFQLVHWKPARQQFDHAQAGFPLQGKHAGLACERCHTANRIVPAERADIKVKDLNRTYLGLVPACASCHEDKHRGQLGSDCLRCHSQQDWKATSAFDHSRARFALTGAHARVKCAECHGPNPRIGETAKYKDLRFDTCAACHTDPHRGAFAASCQGCHNTASWKAAPPASLFDHARTAYPLTGKHAAVGCAKCHRGADFKKPVAHAQCRDCHADAHKGQFASRADGGECAACHTTAGFAPSSYSVADHSKSAFPLRARHASVACAKCHTGRGPEMRFRLAFARCADCHKDPHNGEFAAAPHQDRCQRCHSEERFLPSTFGLARHKEARFQLEGAHAAVVCTDCHKPAPGKTSAQFRFADHRCESCHRDPHRGQFTPRGAAPGQSTCSRCHSVTDWKDLASFDHAKTAFPLLGSHRGVACAECHKTSTPAAPFREARFAGTPSACSSCHEDVHAGQFARPGSVAECSSCHDARAWKPAKFNHDVRTAFPLKGGHEGVACARCHTQRKQVGARAVLIYALAPKKCAECHAAGVPRR